jgi:hypothetical protein
MSEPFRYPSEVALIKPEHRPGLEGAVLVDRPAAA